MDGHWVICGLTKSNRKFFECYCFDGNVLDSLSLLYYLEFRNIEIDFCVYRLDRQRLIEHGNKCSFLLNCWNSYRFGYAVSIMVKLRFYRASHRLDCLCECSCPRAHAQAKVNSCMKERARACIQYFLGQHTQRHTQWSESFDLYRIESK